MWSAYSLYKKDYGWEMKKKIDLRIWTYQLIISVNNQSTNLIKLTDSSWYFVVIF